MNCQECQRRIMDELASNWAQSAREIIGHREECVSCQQFYDEQAALFSRIDAGMRSLANEAVSPPLLAKVRRSLLEEPPRYAIPLWGYATVATACAVLLSFAYIHRRPGEQTALRAEPAVVQERVSTATNPSAVQVEATRPKDGIHHPRNMARKPTIASSKVEPETPRLDSQIVVSIDERRAFGQWLTVFSKQRDSLTAFSKPGPDKTFRLVEIASVHLDSVDVKGMKTEDPLVK